MKRVVLLAGVLALIVAGTAAGAGDGVIILRSSDLAPYKALEAAFVGAVGVPVKVLTLADQGEAKSAAASAAVVLAIGQDAARLALDAHPVGQVILGLVPAPEKLGAAEASKAVPMFVAPARHLSVLRDALPDARRLGVIYSAPSTGLVADYERAARGIGASLVKQEVKERSQVAQALRELIGKVDALVLLPDPATLGVDTFKFVLTTSLEAKVPLVGFSQGQARAGAMLALEANYEEMGREAAGAAKRALSGSAAAPQAPAGSIYVNGKTAQVLGVSIPPQLKAQTKEVF